VLRPFLTTALSWSYQAYSQEKRRKKEDKRRRKEKKRRRLHVKSHQVD
jgi:hypothetical protein